jgi:predicted HTH domain antitoxin
MRSLQIDIPYEVSDEEARVLLAIGLFREGKISVGKAAEIAGYGRRVFMEILSHRGVPCVEPAANDIEEDLANA